MADFNTYISNEAGRSMRGQIADVGGNEIFVVGYLNSDRIVTSVEVFARGNEFSAPALLQVAEQGNVVIHNHPSGRLYPSQADMHVASILGNDGIGFYIVNNSVTKVYVAVEPFVEETVVPVDAEKLAALLKEDGPIAKRLSEYEFRPQQVEMMRDVSRAINEDKFAILEAGTGTGKTIAYLLPAIAHSVQNKERIVVSTNTINLQEQLVNKDLPFLSSVVEEEFLAVLVKGRTNYACRRKLAEANQDFDLFSENENQSELKEILAWAKTTKDGSKSDLNIIPKYDVWEKVQSESDTSLKAKCPFYDRCFFYSARRKAAKANILVTNHHLLFSDLAVRAAMGASENAILPSYDRILFDEAHNIEDVATSYFGIRVTHLGVLRMFRRFYRQKGDAEKGLLPFLSAKLTGLAAGIPHKQFMELQGTIQEFAIPRVSQLESLLAAAMETLFEKVKEYKAQDSFYDELKLRLTADIFNREDWRIDVLTPAGKLISEIRRFTSRLNEFLSELETIEKKVAHSTLSLTIDLRAQLDRLDVAASNIESVLMEKDSTSVRWLEIKSGYKGSNTVRLLSSPLEVAPILKESVYEKFKNIVMTSATLTVDGSFAFLKSRLGIDRLQQSRIIENQLPAPFDYEKQTVVAIPRDIEDPRNSGFFDDMSEMIAASIEISRGRAFVLFTSYGLLNKVYKGLRNTIEAFGYNVYKQGQENRHRLLERFREDTNSVLFATDSFWEGVDVHGEALESVIITKLPFRVPSEPIVEARMEAIEQRGGNAFLEFLVPQAAIKLKQGFGRLIRRKTDRGAVLILDKRVVEKSYGRIFLNSLPQCRIVTGSKGQILTELKAFYAQAHAVNN